MLSSIHSYLETLDLSTISDDRKKELEAIIDYVRGKIQNGEHLHLNFICTHNSRRSQFSQVWAQVLSTYHGIAARCYSGGVEVTAFNPRAISALGRAGFEVQDLEGDNPKYFLRYAEDAADIVGFSKLFDDPVNPTSDFAAVMTCSHADANCPFVPGAEARISMRFEDPKRYDDMDIESKMYDASCRLIATELNFVFTESKKASVQ